MDMEMSIDKDMENRIEIIPASDRSYLENKYHNTEAEFDSFNRMAYHGYEYDCETGLSDEEIDEGLSRLVKKLEGESHALVKAKAVAYVLDHTRIDINEKDYFVGIYSWGRLIDKYTVKKWHSELISSVKEEPCAKKVSEFGQTGAAWVGLDFDHTVPDWKSMTELGFPGLLRRIEDTYSRLKKSNSLSEKQETFYLAMKIEYEAIIRFIDRLYQYSLTKHFAKAEVISACLKSLRDGAPQNTYEMLQMIYLYFMISESIDHYQVRSLGYGLDATLYPFYRKDVEQKIFSKEELEAFIAYFLMQFSAIGSYWGQPVYLAGTNCDGSSKVNEVSYLILDIYDRLGLYNPKIQIKISAGTPKKFVCQALEMIRSGTNSIVFCNEDIIVKSMMKSGATYEEAMDAVVKGCYEYAVRAGSVGISFNTFNAAKVCSLVFWNGADLRTGIQVGVKTGEITDEMDFKSFYQAYLTQYGYLIETAIEYLNQIEPYVHEVNPSLLYSGTIPACVEKMTDALGGGVKNVSDMLVNGLGTAVDSLMAVYELVYEKKATMLVELKHALECNWEGYEKLRIKALNCKHKYGTGDQMADAYANALHQFFALRLADRKNSHGGNYEYELHSARAFLEQGKLTEATPDGRKYGEETSKNASPTPGVDKNGVTALISSATTMDFSLSDSGACLDVMLHPSSVQGEDGLEVLYSVLDIYRSKGGASIHFNIFNADTLRDAQKNPQKYRNLQVRVCGWNVLWNNMNKEEQNAYIKRAENISF